MEHTHDFDAALDRIRFATGCRTQVELAALFGLRQSSISDAKRRGSLPDSWLVILLERYALSPVWIKSGGGAAYLREDPDKEVPDWLSGAPAPAPVAVEPDVSALLDMLRDKLGDSARIVLVAPGQEVVVREGPEPSLKVAVGD